MTPTLFPGDHLVEPVNGPFGKLLTWALAPFGKKPRYQHVRVVAANPDYVIEDGEDFDEVTGKTVGYRVCYNKVPEDFYERYEVYRPLCDPVTNLRALNYMDSKLGELYDPLSLVGYLIRNLLGFRSWPHSKGNDCSKLAAWSWAQAGYDMFPGVDDGDVAPWDYTTCPYLKRI